MDLLNLTPKTDDIVIELALNGAVIKNEDGSIMTWTIMAPYSEEAKKIVHDMTDTRIDKAAKSKNTRLKSAEVEEITLEGLAKTTRDWNITWDGKKPKYSMKLAMEILSKAPWIRNLIEEARQDNLDFMKV